MLEKSSFRYQNDSLHCDRVSLTAIAEAVGTPVYVYSQAELLHRAHAYLNAAAATQQSALVCYAVKANGNPEILRLLAQAGLGADVTSGGELFLARHAGIPPDKVIFSGVGKTRPEIEMALTAGIRALHVESEMELAAIAEMAEKLQRVASIAVRLNPDVHADTHPYISTGRHTDKFGVSREQAMRMLHDAAAHPWLHPVGLAAHIGSQINDLAPFVESAILLCQMAADLATAGIHLQYLDVGGGLAIDYTQNDHAPDPAAWVAAVAAPVVAAGYEVVMEPGRSLVGPAGALITQVLYTKNQGDKTFVITDAGMNDLLRPTLYNAYHPIVAVSHQLSAVSRRPSAVVDVVGPICESGDWLARDRELPPLHPGDLLAILQAGAYGYAMSSNYNGRPRAAEVLVNGESFRVIRERETYEDLLRGCVKRET